MGIFSGILLLSDVDGTLLHRTLAPPQKNIEAIRYFEENGGMFAIATGRTPFSATIVSRNSLCNVPCVCSNGSTIFDYEKMQFLFAVFLSDDDKKIVRQAYINTNRGILVECDDDSYVLRCDKYTERHDAIVGYKYKPASFDELKDRNWIKSIIMSDDIEKTEALKADILSAVPKANLIITEPEYLEVMPRNMNKSVGALKLKELLHAEKLCTMGDYYNDLEMLTVADVSATVSTAPEIVKNSVDRVFGTATEGAVADFIYSLKG